MIDIDPTDPDMVILSPNGALSKSDFDAVAKAIDTHTNETDRAPIPYPPQHMAAPEAPVVTAIVTSFIRTSGPRRRQGINRALYRFQSATLTSF
jgi:hypothetical protein